MRMNMLSKALPPAIAGLVLVLAGCATPNQPAVVTRASIQNSSVGYKGYTLEIPPGFKAGEAQTAGREVPLWADVSAAMFNGQMKQELGIKFSESFFIYNPKMVIFFAVMVVDTHGGSFSMIDDRQANRYLLNMVNPMFKKNPHASGQTELITENKHRGARASGSFKSNDQTEMNFQIYKVLGELDEVYYIDGRAHSEDKEELATVVKQLVRGLKF